MTLTTLLSVLHQIREHIAHREGTPDPVLGLVTLALSASLFLSVHLDWRPSSSFAAASSRRDLFAFSSLDD